MEGFFLAECGSDNTLNCGYTQGRRTEKCPAVSKRIEEICIRASFQTRKYLFALSRGVGGLVLQSSARDTVKRRQGSRCHHNSKIREELNAGKDEMLTIFRCSGIRGGSGCRCDEGAGNNMSLSFASLVRSAPPVMYFVKYEPRASVMIKCPRYGMRSRLRSLLAAHHPHSLLLAFRIAAFGASTAPQNGASSSDRDTMKHSSSLLSMESLAGLLLAPDRKQRWSTATGSPRALLQQSVSARAHGVH
ncbi:hypothetical protein BDZ88DRAFT_282947 [Geranomyces variabilis]|nr:hypothetical protein BDZ88DRAFT_282947 [Geranomyces variabilis]